MTQAATSTEQQGRATLRQAHSTPDPESPPTKPPPAPVTPDDEPDPAHAPVQDPKYPEPPMRAA